MFLALAMLGGLDPLGLQAPRVHAGESGTAQAPATPPPGAPVNAEAGPKPWSPPLGMTLQAVGQRLINAYGMERRKKPDAPVNVYEGNLVRMNVFNQPSGGVRRIELFNALLRWGRRVAVVPGTQIFEIRYFFIPTADGSTWVLTRIEFEYLYDRRGIEERMPIMLRMLGQRHGRPTVREEEVFAEVVRERRVRQSHRFQTPDGNWLKLERTTVTGRGVAEHVLQLVRESPAHEAYLSALQRRFEERQELLRQARLMDSADNRQNQRDEIQDEVAADLDF